MAHNLGRPCAIFVSHLSIVTRVHAPRQVGAAEAPQPARRHVKVTHEAARHPVRPVRSPASAAAWWGRRVVMLARLGPLAGCLKTVLNILNLFETIRKRLKTV